MENLQLKEKVKQTRIATRNHYLNVYEWTGDTTLVVAAVAKYIREATCTQQYEHMLPRVQNAEIIDGKLVITTVQSNYAGD